MLLYCCGWLSQLQRSYYRNTMLTTTKVLTRSYTVSLRITYSDPDYGTATDYAAIEAVVPQGYTPGIGGEVARVEAYAAAEYPGWEITHLCLTDEPDIEF